MFVSKLWKVKKALVLIEADPHINTRPRYRPGVKATCSDRSWDFYPRFYGVW